MGVVFFILTGLERRLTCVEEREHTQYKVNGIEQTYWVEQGSNLWCWLEHRLGINAPTSNLLNLELAHIKTCLQMLFVLNTYSL